MRKFICLVLVTVLLSVPVYASNSVEQFMDIPEDAEYRDAVEYAVASGIVNGISPTEFAPDDVVTVEQFSTMLGRALIGEFDAYLDWALRYMCWSPDGDDTLSVEQAGYAFDACIRDIGLELMGYSPTVEVTDLSEVSDWALPSVERALWYGIIVSENGYINPDFEVTRADAVCMLVRLIKAMENAAAVPHSGVVYSDLIRGDYELIVEHSVENVDAVDNNIRYLLQNGLTELVLRVDEVGSGIHYTGSNYGDVYWDILQHYPEFGLKYVWSWVDGDKLHLQFKGYPEDYEALCGYQDSALQAAIKVRDELYNSGELQSYMTQREKAKVYFDWLVNHCEYDWESCMGGSRLPFAWMAYGPIIRGYATCQGYTAAMNLFMRLEGVECSTERTPAHIWSVVTLDGVTYHIDATWSDMCETDSEPYFCMPDGSLVEGYGM